MKAIKILTSTLIAVSLFSLGCMNRQYEAEEELTGEQTQAEEAYMPGIEKAICVLYPTEGNDVSGTVTFTKTGSGIRIEAVVTGLSEGKHGFHIHQLGDCSAPDATSAGGHFNPENMPHAAPADKERHVGDLGNIVAGPDGNDTLTMTDTLIAFHGEHSIIGRAVVVHQNEDDLTTQPTGAAGPRVACGVIGIDEQ